MEIQVEGFKLLIEGQLVEFTPLKRDRGIAAEDILPVLIENQPDEVVPLEALSATA